jgi:RNA polymerase sigma factor (TIGR02999 family)
MASSSNITQLLIAWSGGDQTAFDELMPLIYDDLHRMARRHMRQQRPNHTLQTTALINEAYMRLVGEPGRTWQNRAHFFGVAAKAMRHVLVDYARKVSTQKRGGVRPAPLNEAVVIAADRLDEVVALDDALIDLEKLNPRQCQVVELRYFGGLSVEETAENLKVSPDTVARNWRTARAWLYRRLSDYDTGTL